MINMSNIIGMRMQRQRINEPADTAQYAELFRDMSPVSTQYWTAPGNPPLLSHRANFDDYAHNDGRRARREIVKGRFQGGNVAYVDIRDLELYACAYRKDLGGLTFPQRDIIELIRREGPMNIGMMKEITGQLVKEITPVLHKLQEAFIVYEDQVDSEGDRAWYIFEDEFPEVNLNRHTRVDAIAQIILRFLKMNVFADAAMIKSFYKFTAKDIKAALAQLVSSGSVKSIEVDAQSGYILTEDAALLAAQSYPIEKRILILHRYDFLAKSYEHIIKEKYKSEQHDILKYIMADGEFVGAFIGRFTFSGEIIEDVIANAPGRESEIVQAIYQTNGDTHQIKLYNGKPLT